MKQADSPNVGWNEPVFRVSEINETVRELLRETFPLILIEGEVSDLFRARSGHWYFTLKDEQASLRCVMFAPNAQRAKHAIEDGALVRIRAELSLYQQRGDFQAVVKHIEPVGEGALRLAFEELRAKLMALGWFDESIKKTLPRFPRRIVVVSSPKGDATRDVFTNIRRRYPIVELALEPTSVQGSAAAQEIVHALTNVNTMEPHPDLAILTRGGGSLEDLYVFNSELVAEAIFRSDVPIVSAIGHEADYTIADFCADLRAPTPSTAAELVTPDAAELLSLFGGLERDLQHRIATQISTKRTLLEGLSQRVRDPKRDLASWSERIEDSSSRIEKAAKSLLLTQFTRIAHFEHLLQRQNPAAQIRVAHAQLHQHLHHMKWLIDSRLENFRGNVANLGRNLHAVSPLATLDRGFAVVSRPNETEFGQVIRSTSSIDIGEDIQAHIADGTINSRVTEVVRKDHE
ncbi:MAG: exodeoxyribonuclease VII large subunit [Gammaproteobacteria bacterium]|nr:exodeoxyribonuclease VII large subunit [Gammaproteobacteria bacterium]